MGVCTRKTNKKTRAGKSGEGMASSEEYRLYPRGAAQGKGEKSPEIRVGGKGSRRLGPRREGKEREAKGPLSPEDMYCQQTKEKRKLVQKYRPRAYLGSGQGGSGGVY